MALKTTPYDPADYLTDPEDQADLLTDALASGHAGYIANALGIVARVRGITKVARETGLTRMALYKALTKEGDPKLTTVVKVLGTLNLGLTAVPIKRGRGSNVARRKSRRAVGSRGSAAA